MANNYVQFSEGIDRITPEERTWIEVQLDADRWEVEAPEWNAPVEEEELDFEWSFDTRFAESQEGEHFLWLYAEESGCPDQVAEFVRAFLARFRPEGCFSLTYAETCSKPRLGEFSGGAIFVTADGHQHEPACFWVDRQEEEHLRARSPAIPGRGDPASGGEGEGEGAPARIGDPIDAKEAEGAETDRK
jgi:hypothetical protein